MRERIERRAFGLVLGAGVSKPLNFPNWDELVERISTHGEVDAAHLMASATSASATEKTQMLLQHYRSKRLDELGDGATARNLRMVDGEWQQIVKDELYRDTTKDINAHPYLLSFAPTILKSPITITYNFDDVLERILAKSSVSESEEYGRPFETIWDAALQSRRNSPMVYHPNGYLPSNLLEQPSEALVFSQDSFADQLIESMAGHHASLLHHFGHTTCLLLGLSLSDETLRHFLRQNVRIHPGHCHYFIRWVRPDEQRDEKSEQSMAMANFEVSNLVTLFLTEEEIEALGCLLTVSEEELKDAAEEEGVPLKYVYYITGAIGAGKTTVLNNLRSLLAYEEWTEPRHPGLAKSWKSLSEEERLDIDEWIARQFVKKDSALRRASSGLHVVDRPPLDPLSFTAQSDVRSKALSMLNLFSPGESNRTIQAGQVIVLRGDPAEMEARVVGRHKKSDRAVISELQDRIGEIYVSNKVVETAGRSAHEVVREVAKLIHLEQYSDYDIHKRLESISENGMQQ
ncbi:SIR2 family protein [uncultured Tateyamaria sp.]|uniref:SIR2 family protein n=1 Tax=uncultured Tateyamaria sp. TaxID=455651 RepID=UPI00261CEA27|nr:SIR2 family protein [uncultured Tateyamaria sp.]